MTEFDKKYTYFITGGGTGGHIYPALAVAEELRQRGQNIFYIGNPNNLEYGIVTQKDFSFLPVSVHGMPRKAGIGLFKWGMELILAVLKGMYYIQKYKPDAVFGTGGYVSAPALLSAKIMKVPYVLHDCDAQPGLVTRKLAPNAEFVSIAFECAKEEINNQKCQVNGNPIRKAFKDLSKSQAREILGLQDKLTLCIMGGSQGARSINDAAVEIIKRLSTQYDLQIIFQTGKKNFERVIEQLIKVYPEYESDKNFVVRPYFDDMVSVLKASDIAVSRSGSLSLSELCASGIASILVPYPHAAADHQRKNARYLEAKGAALYLEDSEVSEDTLMKSILSLLQDKDNLAKLQNSALALAKYDSVDLISDSLIEVAANRK